MFWGPIEPAKSPYKNANSKIDHLVTVVAERAGGIDVLVNCAAVYALTLITEVSREQRATLFSVDVDGTFFAAAPT